MASHPASRVDTVLFDVDDTLLDSYRARIQALRDVFTRANVTGLDAEKFLVGLRGAPFQDALEHLTLEHDTGENLFILYRRIYWIERLGNIRLFPGVREMLVELKSRGYKLGIVTSKGRNFEFEGKRVGCTYELKELDILEMFSVIIGFEDVTRYKPHPDGINAALDKLGSKSPATLFVGDSAADIEAAHHAGCRSCLATWGVDNDFSLPENLRAHYMINTPGDLLALDCLEKGLL